MSPRKVTTRRGQRYYEWRGEKYWSVTTIINGGVPKPQLVPWAIREVAEGAVAMIDTLPRLVKQSPGAAVDMLKGLPWAKKTAAADVGTSIHERAEALVKGRPLPPVPGEIAGYIDAFDRWRFDWQPQYVASEATVYNRAESYAGTLDAIIQLDGEPWLLDVKTGKGVYPEVALQLAAYRHAEFIAAPDGTENPMPAVYGGLVLHLRPDGYDLYPVECGKAVLDVFRHVREVFRWQEETGKCVIGEPLTVIEEETP